MVRQDFERFGQGAIALGLSLILIVWAAKDGRVAGAQPTSVTLVGELLPAKSRGPVLKTREKEYRLSSQDQDLNGVLRDSRMAGRHVQLLGRHRGSDRFEVERLKVIRGNKLYSVVYYCEVCNLTAFSAGDCVCCQMPLELIEVQPDDARVIVK